MEQKKLTGRWGKVFKALREEYGISQNKLEKDHQINKALVSNLENGVREPSINNLRQYGDAFGLSATLLWFLYEYEYQRVFDPALYDYIIATYPVIAEVIKRIDLNGGLDES